MWYKYNTTITAVVLFYYGDDKSNRDTVIVVKRVSSLAKTIVVDVIVIYIPRIPLWYFLLWASMHHRKTYMHINFQQNRVSRSVKNVHTNFICEKNRKLHKFATTILKTVCANL